MSDTLDRHDARTARLNLLVTEAEKKVIEEKAHAAGLTVSELLRRAAFFYDPDVDVEELEALTEALNGMADRLLPELDAALARMDARDAALPDLKEKWRSEAMRRLRHADAPAITPTESGPMFE